MRHDRYEIIDQLGSGGWGDVLLAIDKNLGRQVAIKTIPLDAQIDISAIQKEAASLVQLDHPGIVKLIEFFKDDKKAYLVTEYIEGDSLDNIISLSNVSHDQVYSFTDKVTEILDYIHNAGIIHSDLKPANIIVDKNDNPHIIDFGITRTASAEIATDIKEIRGTLHYMSPEQAEGNPYDIRSDLFSLGVILYELFTGQKPFQGEYDMAVIYSIIYEEPIPPVKINANISPSLSKAILQLLRKNPDDRPSSATEVKKIFEQVRIAQPERDLSSNRMAVLPLEFPDDEESRLIAEGLKDELFARLHNIEDIDIISPIQVKKHANELGDGQAIRNLLGADKYLTGRVSKLGDNIRIYMMLIDSSNDSVVWSHRFDKPLSDLFEIIEVITNEVINKLKLHFGQTDRIATAVNSTVRPEAYELYLLARSYYIKNTHQDNEYARKMFNEALKIDPNYALAIIGVADTYCLDYMNYFDRGQEIISKAQSLTHKALEIMPNLPEAYRTLGRIMQLTGDYKKAAEYYLKAVTYKEDYFQAYRSLGWISKDSFKYNEALGWVRKSLSINSADIETIYLKGVIHFERKESKKAINDFSRCLELRPDYGRAHFYSGLTYFQLGRVEQAIASMKNAIDLGGDINAPYLLGYYYLVINEYKTGLDILKDASSRPEIAFISEYLLGLTYFLMEDPSNANRYFQSSAAKCQIILKEEPSFAIVRGILAKSRALLGEHQAAVDEADQLRHYSTFDGSIAFDMAKTYAILGQFKKAEEYINRALETPQGPTLPEISLDPVIKMFYSPPSKTET